MSTLTNTKVKDTYPLLLKLTSGSIGGGLTIVQDGQANDSGLALSTTGIGVGALTFYNQPNTGSGETAALFVQSGGNVVKQELAGSAFSTPTLLGGTGISVSGGFPNYTITNTSPDQTVSLTGVDITIGGAYPNFTITNPAPDQVVSLSGGQDINVTGTYPSFTINHGIGSIGSIATDTGTPVPFVAMTGANIGLTMNGAGGIVVDADDANKTITIQNTAPDQVVSITGSGSATITGTYPNFDISVPTVAGVHEEMFVAVNEAAYTLAPSNQQVVEFTQPDNTKANASYHFGTAPAKLELSPTYDYIENVSGGDIVIYIDMSAYVDVLSPNSDITYSLVLWDGITWSTVKSVTRYKGSAGNQVDSFWGIFNLKNGDRLRIVISSDSGNVIYVQNNQIKFEVKELGNII